MNKFNQKNCHYFTPSKTIETISVSHGIIETTLFIYNYKGISFRVFLSRENLDAFWEGESEEDHHFENENELDAFLTQFKS
ncbi:MAG: hypothetical protein WDZ80_00975 [Candidatus Paceibacterota bacterium]